MLRGSNLPPTRDGRRVRVAKMLSARQRPGTAKGFVFALEDQTGLASVIVRFDLFNGSEWPLLLTVPARGRAAAAPEQCTISSG